MATIKELKQDSKSALKYLHDKFSFDFQKPVTIIKEEGKFTANYVSIYLSKVITPFFPEDYEIVLLIRHYNYCNQLDKLHAVICDGDKFTVDVPRGYKYDIDSFYNKRVFDEVRKKRTAYYYIIAQKKEHLCLEHSVAIDYTERFDYFPDRYEQYSDGKGNTYYHRVNVKEMSRNKKPIQLDIQYRRFKSLNEIIDKSGYLIYEYRSQLMNRVHDYKTKKRKDEFLATDYSYTVKALNDLFETLKVQIADTVKNITNYNQARLAEKAMDKFAWGLSYFIKYRERIENKEYDSKQYAESSEQNIRKYLDEAEEALREAANETND